MLVAKATQAKVTKKNRGTQGRYLEPVGYFVFTASETWTVPIWRTMNPTIANRIDNPKTGETNKRNTLLKSP
jgi:hypothetical protein